MASTRVKYRPKTSKIGRPIKRSVQEYYDFMMNGEIPKLSVRPGSAMHTYFDGLASGLMPQNVELPFKPQPGFQERVLQTQCDELFAGGARGAGKSFIILLDFAQHALKYGTNARGIIFRRQFVDLEDLIDESHKIFPAIGGTYHPQKSTWLMNNGAQLRFRYLATENDATKYQGHQYCVAVGTRVVMANGSLKPIEDIKVGEMVRTLEGPRRVTHRVAPYSALCISASVSLSDGCYIGEQIHPYWHPIFSTAGLSYGRSFRSPQTSQIPQDASSAPCTQDEESQLYDRRASWGWISFSEDDRTCCRASAHEHRVDERPQELSFPVVLHEQTARQCHRRLRCGGASTLSHSRCRSYELMLGLCRWMRLESFCQPRWRESSQSTHLTASQPQPNALSCVLSATRTDLGSLWRCSLGHRRCGERAPSSPEIDRGDTPSRVCAEVPCRSESMGATGTTQTHTRHCQPTYRHPYTGEERCLSEVVEVGQVVMRPYGLHDVADITVEHANHYITELGIVNSNTFVGIEEAGTYANFDVIKKLKATLRSAAGVKVRLHLNGNPGGPLHNVLKQRYVTAGPPNIPIFTRQCFNCNKEFKLKTREDTAKACCDSCAKELAAKPPSKAIEEHDRIWSRIFLPGLVTDNVILLDNDPGYPTRLRQSGPEWLVKAWLDGDWNIVAGGMFDDIFYPSVYESNIVVPPFKIPDNWQLQRSFDWGSSKPFHVGWWVESDGEPVRTNDGQRSLLFPRGSKILVGEWYGAHPDRTEHANEGIGMVAKEIASGLLDREMAMFGRRAYLGIADSAIWIGTGTTAQSIAAEMAAAGVHWQQCIKGPGSRVNGWALMRERLKAAAEGSDAPGMYVCNTCTDWLRTVPSLSRDPRNMDDVDTASEDHAGDSARYLLVTPQFSVRTGNVSELWKKS